MPRQNFLNREAFMEASEQGTREAIKAIPLFANHIRFTGEDHALQSLKFSYSVPCQEVEYAIRVSVLPLNEKYTRISLHGEHSNGEAFMHDHQLHLILHDFEAAVTAALSNNTVTYAPLLFKEKKAAKVNGLTINFSALASLFVLKKRFS